MNSAASSDKGMGDSEAAIQREPFGSPDGASEEAGSFVEFNDVRRWQDLALMPNDKKARILVGRRGSGKSRYLRRIEREALEDNFVFKQYDDFINSDALANLHDKFPERAERLEIWERLWHVAILKSLSSYILFGPRSDARKTINVSEAAQKYLTSKAGKELSSGPSPSGVVTTFNGILAKETSKGAIINLINNEVWTQVEQIVLNVVQNSTPIFVLIDVLDDNYANRPKQSTDCQLGLITWIMKKVTDPSISHRLHVVVTVRDVVYASLLETANGRRYNQRSHVRCLDWNRDSATYFLESKIRSLHADFIRANRRGTDPIQMWLGEGSIRNEFRADTNEEIADYILRHTRCLPREIVELGNALSIEIASRRSLGKEFGVSEIRSKIGDQARVIAKSSIEEIACHLIAMEGVDKPNTPALAKYRTVMTGALNDGFLASFKEERFHEKQLKKADKKFKATVPWWEPFVGTDVSVADVMWQHGMIGIQRAGSPIENVKYFHTLSHLEGEALTKLPQGKEIASYFLHSSLVDGAKIKAVPLAPRVVFD